jgi:hypothetical protein
MRDFFCYSIAEKKPVCGNSDGEIYDSWEECITSGHLGLSGGRFSTGYYTEKLSPQAQVRFALGLEK